MRTIVVAFVVSVSLASARLSAAGDLMFGCSRPSCGKMCKLVCETTTLTAVGFGCECKDICIPGPSRRGCKHCSTTCCCQNEIEGCPPKIEFCWYDWFACGCAKPRTIRVLTKYQAEREVCSYHWEVVDGCQCCCQGGCRCVYKPAPTDAEVGDVMELTDGDKVELSAWMPMEQPESEQLVAMTAPPAAAATTAAATAVVDGGVTAASATEESKSSVWERVSRLWPTSGESK